MTNLNSYLVISLDFELLWGVFDKVDFRQKHQYFHNTRKVIPQLLKLFKDNEIHCTWASVGMLFNADWEEWSQHNPIEVPSYINEKLSPYSYKFNNSNLPEELCFAPELLDQIYSTPGQEIGTHTYSHYYCLEEGQSLEEFRVDLKLAIDLAARKGCAIKSLVFPRNQFNEEYLKVCQDLGIQSVRINPTNWYWKDVQSDGLLNKIFRSGDAYIGPKDKSYHISEIEFYNHQISLQKASRFLRPHSSKFNSIRLDRIKSEMSYAAKNDEIFHLWWHPHNFGDFPNESLLELEEIITHFKECQSKFGMQSANMEEIHLAAQHFHKTVES